MLVDYLDARILLWLIFGPNGEAEFDSWFWFGKLLTQLSTQTASANRLTGFE